MSTFIALIQPTEKELFNAHRATQSIKDGTAAAERHGIQIRNFYWTSGPCNAVLVLEAADQKGTTGWKNSLSNLRVQVIPTVHDPEFRIQTTNGTGVHHAT
jgi:uncharacterized protein with GYD domain